MFDLVVGIVRDRSEEFCDVWEKNIGAQRAVPRRARTCRRVGERRIIRQEFWNLRKKEQGGDIAWLWLVLFFRSFSNFALATSTGGQAGFYRNSMTRGYCVADEVIVWAK